jgi:DNA topoisomerase-3
MTSAVTKYQVGQVIGAVSARLEQKVTRPPERYSQDELLDDMLAAHKFAKSPEEREVLRSTEGLGTSRTRIAIVTGLIQRGLLLTQKKGKRHEIRSSDFARALVKLLPTRMLDVATTARWEIAFKAIEDGRVTMEQVVERNFLTVQEMVETARTQKAQYQPPSTGFGVPSKNASGGSSGRRSH